MGRYGRYFDIYTIIALIFLVLTGLFVLLTIDSSLFFTQFGYVVVSGLLLAFVPLIHPLLFTWFAPIGYIVSILFLISSYFGPIIRGATRWIVIAGVQLQPSELVKPFMLLAFSYYISKFPPKTFKSIAISTGIFLVPFLLVFKQPDLGSSIVYASMWICMMIAGGLPIRYILGSSMVGIVGFPIFWRFLAEYQKSRIYTFLNPALDPRGAGYNAIQAMIAIGSGQFFGKGLGLGTQSHLRFLPEFHTDFIFATLVEELGFIGGAFLLLAYAFLLWRILSPLFTKVITHSMPFIFSVGLFGMLLSQIVINSGMNMGIIPVTGITLPLVSYGGSSLLSIGLSFAILWAIAIQP